MKVERDHLIADLVGFLSQRPDDLSRFLAATGADPLQLREALSSDAFQSGMIDYFRDNEPLMLAFCEETGTSVHAFAAQGAFGETGEVSSGTAAYQADWDGHDL